MNADNMTKKCTSPETGKFYLYQPAPGILRIVNAVNHTTQDNRVKELRDKLLKS
jgi:hypothetical protein